MTNLEDVYLCISMSYMISYGHRCGSSHDGVQCGPRAGIRQLERAHLRGQGAVRGQRAGSGDREGRGGALFEPVLSLF